MEFSAILILLILLILSLVLISLPYINEVYVNNHQNKKVPILEKFPNCFEWEKGDVICVYKYINSNDETKEVKLAEITEFGIWTIKYLEYEYDKSNWVFYNTNQIVSNPRVTVNDSLKESEFFKLKLEELRKMHEQEK